ncbi:large ribosomal subunit protein mL43-like [Acropora muricata]|uniref:large ribosomal subunit protein mL43-like n=1 Tax=Acropora muricata TaxID=159855 RepID=UPI0010FCB70C
MAQVEIPNRVFGRFVRPLQRLVLNYCKHGGSSRGIREYIDKEIVEFATNNPEVTIYVRERNGKHPRIVANFINGNSKIVEVKNKTPEEIEHWVERLRHESGVKVQKIRKFWHTENPSIQGTWTPFLNKPPSLRRSAVNTLTAQSKFSS